MTNKVAYYKHQGEYGWRWEKLNHTGKCKYVQGGPWLHLEGKYYQHAYFFGILKMWVHENSITLFNEESEKLFECNCLEDKAL